MDLTLWAIVLIAIWLIGGAVASASYFFGFEAGLLEGAASGLDNAYDQIATALENDDYPEPQPLIIRYAMRTGGDESSTPISGRLVLDDMTRADWTSPESHKQIRTRLLKSFPGCEVIGYAILDRCNETN